MPEDTSTTTSPMYACSCADTGASNSEVSFVKTGQKALNAEVPAVVFKSMVLSGPANGQRNSEQTSQPEQS